MSVTLFIIGGLSVLFIKHVHQNGFVSEFNVDKFIHAVKPVGITMIHKLIYLFSFLQMQYFKAQQYVNTLYDTDAAITNENSIKTTIETFNKNRKLSHIFEPIPMQSIVLQEIISKFPLEYDLIILSDDSKPQNKICYNTLNDNIDYKYDLSDIKFISVKLTYINNQYDIKLKTEDFNYYIVNNVIDDVFLKYYLVHILKIVLDKDIDFTYKLEIIDHMVNVINLDINDSIIILKDGYNVSIDSSNNSSSESSTDSSKCSYDFVIE